MDRRNALKTISLGTGLSLSSGFVIAILNGCKAKYDPGYQPLVLTPEQDKMVAELVELIIPTTDTPGAKAAGVNQYIDTALAKAVPEDEKVTFIKGLEDLDYRSNEQHGDDFVNCTPEQKVDMLKKLESESKKTVEKTFFDLLKEATVFGYYTSEIGASEELKYIHVTGTYKGDVPYSEVGRSYS